MVSTLAGLLSARHPAKGFLPPFFPQDDTSIAQRAEEVNGEFQESFGCVFGPVFRCVLSFDEEGDPARGRVCNVGRWHGPGNAASCLRCAIFRGIRLLGTSLLRSAQGASLLQRCECYHDPALGFKGCPGEGAAAGCSSSLRFDIISPVDRGEILSGSWRLDAPRIGSAVSENTATI